MSDYLRISYQLSGSLAEYGPQIREAASDIVAEHTNRLQAAIVESFEDDKSGRLYTRANGEVYQASAPGEAPAVREGTLQGSIQQLRLGDLARAVISTDPKAPFLEYGSGDIEARPFFTPAAEAAREAFLSDMANLEARLRRR